MGVERQTDGWHVKVWGMTMTRRTSKQTRHLLLQRQRQPKPKPKPTTTIILYFTLLYCTVLDCTRLYCTTRLYCIALHSTVQQYCKPYYPRSKLKFTVQ